MEQIQQQISDLAAQLAAQLVTPEIFMGVAVVVCFGLGWIAGRMR